MNKMFVVVETGFDYNDEYHYVTGDGRDGTPVAVFTDQAAAKAEAARLTIDQFLLGWAGTELHGFGEGVSEVFDRKPSFVDMDDDMFFDYNADHAWDLDSVLKIKTRSREELEEIAAAMRMKPYFVTEVPVGQTI